MLLPTNRQRTFLPSNVPITSASNTSVLHKKQFLMAKIPLVLETDSNLTAQQWLQGLQTGEKLSKMMISVLTQLKTNTYEIMQNDPILGEY